MSEQVEHALRWQPVSVSDFPAVDLAKVYISMRALTEFIRANDPDTPGAEAMKEMLGEFLQTARAARTAAGYWKLIRRGHTFIVSSDGQVVTGYGRRPPARGTAVSAEEDTKLPVGYLRNDLPAAPYRMPAVTEQTVRDLDPARLYMVSRSRRQLKDAQLLDPRGDAATMAALAPTVARDLRDGAIHISPSGHWVVVGPDYLWVLSEDSTRLHSFFVRRKPDDELAEEILKEACE